MTSAIRIAVAAALSFTSITLAHAQSADVEKRQVVALADTGAVQWSAVEETPDRYAGRYVTADGHAFAITVADDGEVSGASIVRATEQAVATTREALRGIVTILDSSEEIATAGLRRGIVTIIDVVNDVATSAVAPNAVASTN